MDTLVTLNGQNFVTLILIFIGTTLITRLVVFANGPRNGLKEENSQKELWLTSLASGGIIAGYFLLLMILGFYFLGSGMPSNEPNIEFHPW